MNGDRPPPPPGFSYRDRPPPPPGFSYDKPEEPGMLQAIGTSVGKAARAFPGSVGQAGADMWNLVTHSDEVLGNLKQMGWSGVVSAVKDDLLEHYGSLDKAKNTFETDPFRFLTDISLPLTGGGSVVAKLGIMPARFTRKVLERAAPLMTGAPRQAFQTAGEVGAEGGTRAATFRMGQAGQLPPRPGRMLTPEYSAGKALSPLLPTTRHDPYKAMIELATRGGVGSSVTGAAAAAGIPWWATAPLSIAAQSPRLMGSTTYGLGAAERGLSSGAGTLGRAAVGSAVQQPREFLQDQAKQALKDKQFKKDKTPEQLKVVRKIATDPHADSKAMTAAQKVLGGYRPLQLTVRPEQGAYGGPEGGQANDAMSGVVSRQEGGPLAAGQPAVVGETPGGEPRPELFVPDRGPSPAQAAGAAGTEAMGWISDAWGSILRGEKPPPLPELPETGKVPSTADPRPVQALGEQTSALSQLVGPPGAAAAKGGMALGAAAMGARAGKGLLKGAIEDVARPAARELGAVEKAAPRADAPFPQYAKEYPPIGEPVMTWDAKKGRYYPAKGESPEAAAFLKAREKIREQMKTEGYTPYFDPAARTHVDPSGYPARTTETLDIVPKKREALDKHLQAINAPEVRKRLRDAIKKGQTLGDTADWYAMGQLESEFVKEFGAKQGRVEFLNTFAAPMAATTGGMDPTGNLLLASYLNYLRAGSKALPTESWQVPKGFGGGKYGVMPNIRQYETKMEGGGYGAFGAENPKRLDFMRAFLGDRYHPVMDEQMTQGMTPGLSQPPPGTYGLYARKAIEVGKEQGLKLTPDDVQAIAWAGFKDEAGKPMISHFNDAVERTHRLTGMPRQEIVRGWMRREIPLYGGAGATIMAPELARETTGDRQ